MNKQNLGVVLLPILISLALVISVNALKQDNSELKAHVNVFPTGIIDCRPDVLNLKSKGKYVTCFIELESADVKDIDISTVRLSIVGKSGFVQSEPSPTYLNDYDYDGRQDLMVKFNRTKVENFFTGLINPEYFDFNVSGYAKGFPFFGVDKILVTNPAAIKLVTYFQIESKELGKGKINHIETLDLTNYATTFNHFSGDFFVTDSRLHGYSSFYFQGKVKNKFLGITYYKPVTVLAQFDELEDCYAFDNTVHCEGKGFLIIKPGRTKLTLDSFSFDIKDNKVTIAGGKYFSDLLSVVDVPVNIIRIKYK
jgi:hypothetical protein